MLCGCVQAFAEIYDIVIDAFLYFDKNNSGYLDKDEVMEGFSEGATPSAKKGVQITGFSGKRFEELDWDKNGQVSFREFLFALEKWLGMEDADVEEAEAPAATNFAESRPTE